MNDRREPDAIWPPCPVVGPGCVIREQWAGGDRDAPLAGAGDHMQLGPSTRNRAR
jgi:hypothetical protein